MTVPWPMDTDGVLDGFVQDAKAFHFVPKSASFSSIEHYQYD